MTSMADDFDEPLDDFKDDMGEKQHRLMGNSAQRKDAVGDTRKGHEC